MHAAGMIEQERQISETIVGEQARLRNFIRRRLPNEADVEDVLQDVFCELVEAYRLMKPVRHLSAWMFSVARNRIIDLVRKKKPQPISDHPMGVSEDREPLLLEDLLPARDAGPEAAYARSVLVRELDAALEELPEEQRQIFVAHEIEGYSFKELSERTGLGVPDSFWRIPRPRGFQSGPPHDGALGTNDSRRTPEVPRGAAEWLRQH